MDAEALVLMEKFIAVLPREQQIGHITAVLQQESVWKRSSLEKGAILLVEMLEKRFESGDDFRSHLMNICRSIPMQIKGEQQYEEQIEVASTLRIAMLGKIIQGWKLVWGPIVQQSEFRLAEECFCFLCKTYKSAPHWQRWGNYPNIHAEHKEGLIRKGILDLFRLQVDRHIHVWKGNDLDQWILHEQTPEAIAELLLHAQIRLGGVEWARQRIRRLQHALTLLS